MPKTDNNSLLSQIDTIARGLSETFSPFCEVVVHDLKNPEHAILSIHNNLSGRRVLLRVLLKLKIPPLRNISIPAVMKSSASVLMTLPLNARRRPEHLNLKTVSC